MEQDKYSAVEEWKDIPGLNNIYMVSNAGLVKSKARTVRAGFGSTRKVKEKILAQSTTPFGYKMVVCTMNGKTYNFYVHRLVAFAFCTNPYGLPIVNHMDSNPANNHYTNLEWCTYSHNIKHSIKAGRTKPTRTRAIVQYDLTGKFIAEYESAREAYRRTGVHNSTICAILNNRQKPNKNYLFKYK